MSSPSFHARAHAARLLGVATLILPTTALAAGPAVTVYTRDLGFVRESRSLDVAGASDTVRIVDVPERIDFPSVRLVLEGGARVTRLAYRWDVASSDALLERARGTRVRATMRGDRVVEGTLIAVDGSWLVIRENDGSVRSLSRTSLDDVRLANPPPSLSLRPALEAAIENGRRGRIGAELSYLTGGLSWSAEHVVVRRGESAATWSSGVTIENQTGRDFVDADLKLVAGEPNRVTPPPMPMLGRAVKEMDMAVAQAADGEALSEENFSEYHLYRLGRPATLRDREAQKLTMLEPRDVKVTPRYLYRGGDPRGVRTQLEVMNTSAAGLGVPLPGGRVRFYETDASGAVQFTGETRIKHTAEDEKLTLDVGAAFDLVAERRETANRRISDREREVAVEVSLRNRKKNDVRIVVEETIGGDVEVTQKTHDFTRKDANTLQFVIPVPAGKEVKLAYTARVRY